MSAAVLALTALAAGAAIAVATLAMLVAADTRRRSDMHGRKLAEHLLHHGKAAEYRIPTNGQADHG